MAALLAGGIVLQVFAPQIVRAFIDTARAGGDQHVLLRAAGLFIGVVALQQIAKVLAAFWSARVAWTATNALRADLTAHLLRLDPSFHKARTPGELIERVDGDVNALASFFSDFAVQLLGSILLMLGVVLAVFRVDVRFGLAMAVFCMVGLAGLSRLWRLATPFLNQTREHSAAFYGYLGEVIGAAEDLRSSGATGYALRRFFEHMRAWLPVQRRAEVRGGLIWLAAIVLFGVGDGLAYALGGGLYRGGAISLGTVYMCVAYVAMLAEPIEAIRTQIEHLQHAHIGMARISALLDTRPRLIDGDMPLPGGALSVEFDSVSFEYDNQTKNEERRTLNNLLGDGASSPIADRSSFDMVLHGISFSVAAGRTLGILGRTGSGKTTIARLLFRMHDPQAGTVRLGGVDLRAARLKDLRNRVGLVTQDAQIFEATLRDNITFFDTSIADERVLAALDALGLAAWLARLPARLDTPIAAGSLSAGEAQLIAFARVFIKDPGLVILDEASSRLDPATEALLERAIDQLLAGRTAIVIAHRLATLDRADDILVLEAGQIVEYGARGALVADARSRFAELRRIGAGEVLA
jgi:ABC-type multidrug transport system fused ATPase/permease subunit